MQETQRSMQPARSCASQRGWCAFIVAAKLKVRSSPKKKKEKKLFEYLKPRDRTRMYYRAAVQQFGRRRVASIRLKVDVGSTRHFLVSGKVSTLDGEREKARERERENDREVYVCATYTEKPRNNHAKATAIRVLTRRADYPIYPSTFALHALTYRSNTLPLCL